MSSLASASHNNMNTSSLLKYWKLAAVTFLGFASGLPLALTGTSMQAWLTTENIDMATIGFFSLVGLPYTFKFLWAPLMDRFELPFFGRRRGWLVLTQFAIAAILIVLSQISPSTETQTFALIATLVAFLAASQDVVIDAYRTDIIPPETRGLSASLTVLAYRLAMTLSGGIAFVWADPVNGNGWEWSKIYGIMATIMIAAGVVSLFLLPSVPKENKAPQTDAKNDLIGFFALVVAVAIGYLFTTKLATPISDTILSPLFPALEDGKADPNLKKWADLVSLLMGLAFTLPLAWWTSKKAKYETLNTSLANYFSLKGAGAFLAFIILYKLGDSFAGSLLTPFLIKGAGFAQAEIGVVNKVLGMLLTIFGGLLGGTLMLRLGLYRSLFIFGVLQLLSNVGFWLVAVLGKGAWGSITLPPFNAFIVSLKEASEVDLLLLFAIAGENITGAMGTAAFVALLMALCNQKFTATQYALLSAFSAVGRVWVGPLAGVLTVSLGWPPFFILSIVMAVPGLILLRKLKSAIIELETPRNVGLLDD